MSKGNPLFGVRLKPEALNALKKLAKEEKRTAAEIIRDEIYKLLDRKGIDYKAK